MRRSAGWLAAQVQQARVAAGQAGALNTVALDGKVLKGAWAELPDIKVTLFSALVHGEGVIIEQGKVPEGTTEVTQVPPLLDGIAAARCARGGPDSDSDLAGLVLLPTRSTPTVTICSRSPTGAGSTSSP